MNQLLIDPSGGMAGDMFTAALISAGADSQQLLAGMIRAGEKLGKVAINLKESPDKATQLDIRLTNNDAHLNGQKAERVLNELIDELKLKPVYAFLAHKILKVLLEAEKKAHNEHPLLQKIAHGHHHSHGHHHGHHHQHSDTFLHEAQDIIIDIVGASLGLQLLDVAPRAVLTGALSVGDGEITFSHGTLPVPAPATEAILNGYHIPYQKGPVSFELCTPTGSAILAALEVQLGTLDGQPLLSGRSRGTKLLDIPPLVIKIF